MQSHQTLHASKQYNAKVHYLFAAPQRLLRGSVLKRRCFSVSAKYRFEINAYNRKTENGKNDRPIRTIHSTKPNVAPNPNAVNGEPLKLDNGVNNNYPMPVKETVPQPKK